MDLLKINKSNILISNKKHYVNDYYQYIISLLRYVIDKNDISINIILDGKEYNFNNNNKTINIKINYEHTLVKKGGRSISGNTPIGKIKYNENDYYLVRIHGVESLKLADIVIDYSNPNIFNVKKSDLYDSFSNNHIYISPSLYENLHINSNNRKIESLTTFINTNEPRRKILLEKISQSALNHSNINNCFDKNKLQELYRNTKVLINIHQTPHHHTFEELRCLPALQNGVIVVSEKSPLNHLIPYNDLIIWTDYDNIINKTKEVLENYEEYYINVFSDKNIKVLYKMDDENKKIMKDKIINIIDKSKQYTNNIQLKRYPIHNNLPNNKKMDLYIYNLNKNIKIAYLSVAKCASNEIRDIFKSLTGDQKRLEINIKDKNDPRLKDLIIFSFIRNPWERFHSSFNMMEGKTSLELPKQFLEFTKNPDKCKKIDPGHWTPQYDKLITENGEILPKYIGNINNIYKYIEHMINDICIEQNIKIDLLKKLSSLKDKQKNHVRNKDFDDNSYYLKYYNKKTYNNVSRYLETDIRLFDFKHEFNITSLTNLSIFYGLDKHFRVSHNFMPTYEKLFKKLKLCVSHLLEIGCGGMYDLKSTLGEGDSKRNFYNSGNSLRMWRDYFIKANVYGIDINKDLMFDEDRIKTFLADQNSDQDLKSVIDQINAPLDIIIDDGSHQGKHQVFSFMYLHKYLSSNGIYVIEDIQPQNIPGFKNLSIFPANFKEYINQNFVVEYFDTRNTYKNKKDDFMISFTKK